MVILAAAWWGRPDLRATFWSRVTASAGNLGRGGSGVSGGDQRTAVVVGGEGGEAEQAVGLAGFGGVYEPGGGSVGAEQLEGWGAASALVPPVGPEGLGEFGCYEFQGVCAWCGWRWGLGEGGDSGMAWVVGEGRVGDGEGARGVRAVRAVGAGPDSEGDPEGMGGGGEEQGCGVRSRVSGRWTT